MNEDEKGKERNVLPLNKYYSSPKEICCDKRLKKEVKINENEKGEEKHKKITIPLNIYQFTPE